MFISDLAVPHVTRHPSAETTSSYTARVNVPWIRERRRQARETGFHGRRPPPGRVGSPSVEGLLCLPPPHNTPAQLTLIQVANHSLLLQEVTAQLLVQAKGQHVVGERAAGETPVAITLLLAQKREHRHWALTLGDGWAMGQHQVKMSPTPPNRNLHPRIKRKTDTQPHAPAKSDPLLHPALVGGPVGLRGSALTRAARR